MKFTAFKSRKFYKRESDGAFFKREDNGEYRKINNDGKWEKSDDLHLSDNFIHTHENPGIDSFEDMFYKYNNGDAESQKRSLDSLLLGLARLADKLTSRENDEL